MENLRRFSAYAKLRKQNEGRDRELFSPEELWDGQIADVRLGLRQHAESYCGHRTKTPIISKPVNIGDTTNLPHAIVKRIQKEDLLVGDEEGCFPEIAKVEIVTKEGVVAFPEDAVDLWLEVYFCLSCHRMKTGQEP